jgi:light-regulated signal transduction histidine kinase (bacteriophytochrome)
MNELVDEVLCELQPDIRGRSISWTVSSLPDAEGDRSLMRQVWMNLLSNAIKYTGNSPAAEIRVGATVLDDGVEYYVQDNGVGLDMKFASKLFGVFQRLHHDGEFEGTGIGLANVRRIVSRHSGSTRAVGILGEGATFYFTLPAGGCGA